MSKHKSEDYKLSAVKNYLNKDVSLDDVCEIFDCPKESLYRQVKRYEELEEIKRINRKPKSYKITIEQVTFGKYAILKLKENEQITMEELCKNVKNKLFILDNGQIHKKEETKKIIKDSGNFLLYKIR